MRIGIIGLGSIAKKAYLPVVTSISNVQPVFATRNQAALKELLIKYRVSQSAASVDELIKKNIDAVFVHTSTESHFEIVSKLLKNNIDVYVDKPLAYTYKESEALVNLAEQKNKILMTGFNRRFAPLYVQIKDTISPRIILMQKNRVNIPGKIREFIFDDFIHVVDTMRFLGGGELRQMEIKPFFRGNEMIGIITNSMIGDCYASGIMYRDNGVTEENVEAIGAGKKVVVKNLLYGTSFEEDKEFTSKINDWEPTLHRRGFEQIINHFISAVGNKKRPLPSPDDSLLTHETCEAIVRKAEEEFNKISR